MRIFLWQTPYILKIQGRACLECCHTVIMDQELLPLPGSLHLCQETLNLGITALDSLLPLATGEPCKAEVGVSLRKRHRAT